MEEKEPSVTSVLETIAKNSKDRSLSELAAKVSGDIIQNAVLHVGISKSDGESVVFTDAKGRPIMTTLGRLMTRHLGYDANKYSLAIQVLSDAYIAELRRLSVSFDIVSGEAIVKAYKDGYGSSSCMTGSASSYTSFVKENTESINLLLFKDRSLRGSARAFLWTDIDGQKVLDRIYPNSGWHIEVIHKWAHGQGIVTREGNYCPGDNPTISDGKTHKVRVSNKFNIWSYMDTFIYGVLEKAPTFILSNFLKVTPAPSFYLCTTGGHPCALVHCDHCKEIARGSGSEVWSSIINDKREIWCNRCAGNPDLNFKCRVCSVRFVKTKKNAESHYCDRCERDAARKAAEEKKSLSGE